MICSLNVSYQVAINKMGDELERTAHGFVILNVNSFFCHRRSNRLVSLDRSYFGCWDDLVMVGSIRLRKMGDGAIWLGPNNQ